MAAAMSVEVLRLYRNTLRAAGAFTDYNFRHYFLRRAREDFRVFAAATRRDPSVDKEAFIANQSANLGMLKRQSAISQMYAESSAPATKR